MWTWTFERFITPHFCSNISVDECTVRRIELPEKGKAGCDLSKQVRCCGDGPGQHLFVGYTTTIESLTSKHDTTLWFTLYTTSYVFINARGSSVHHRSLSRHCTRIQTACKWVEIGWARHLYCKIGVRKHHCTRRRRGSRRD